MKSRISDHKSETITYPCLMYSHTRADEEMVVLFTASDIGTVVYSSDPNWDLGQYSTGWDMEQFEPYNRDIILNND